MSDTDLQLLARYARQHAEDAFAELVRRHVDLIYSAALRQVRSPQLAEEVAQSVFTDLAREAARLKPDTILTAWLCEVTRRTAIDVVRREARRQLREQIATEMNALNASGTGVPPVWSDIEPLLDEAVSALDATDRAAVLLRYFENKSLREVGQALGTSDDAAQKRVSRAVERLREFFAKHGVTVGASGLVVVISANAVQAAPIGLAATISAVAAVAGTTLAATATATVAKTIAMTTLQKAVIGATLAAAIGTGIYEARKASHLRNQIQTLQQQQAPLAERIQQLQSERDEAARQLSALREDNQRLNNNTGELLRLRAEVGRLRNQATAETPSSIDVMPAVASSIQAPTNATEFEAVKSQMTTALHRIGFALRQYMTNEPLGIITDVRGQLNQTIFSNSLALPLDRFQILVRGVQDFASAVERWPKIVIAKSATPIQFEGYYTHFYLLADGTVTATTLGLPDEPIRNGFLPSADELSAMAEAHNPVRRVLLPVVEAFAAANNGQRPTDLSQLQPYVTTSEQQDMLRKEIEKRKSRNLTGRLSFATEFGPVAK